MLKPIADLPDGVLGFEASGEIQASDWMITVTSLFGWMTPGELKRFPAAGRDQTIAWAARDG